MAHRYGLHPSVPDRRDFVLDHTASLGLLPKSATLKAIPAVRDQGQEGSCTGFSITSAYAAQRPGVYSPAYLYYMERKAEHTTSQDAGAQIRDGLKIIQKQGVCTEALMPYAVGDFTVAPPPAAVAEAKENRIRTYARAKGVDGAKHALAMNRPVVLGISVYASFEAVGKDGVVPMPAPNEQLMGGHAILAVGYDDFTQRLKLENSWGASFGDGGFIYLPYAYVDDPQLTFEVWVVTA